MSRTVTLHARRASEFGFSISDDTRIVSKGQIFTRVGGWRDVRTVDEAHADKLFAELEERDCDALLEALDTPSPVVSLVKDLRRALEQASGCMHIISSTSGHSQNLQKT